MKSKSAFRVPAVSHSADEVMARFLKADIELGLASLRFGLHSTDLATRKQAIRDARKACDVAQSMLQGTTFNSEDIQFLAGDLQHLRSELEQLGENFPQVPQRVPMAVKKKIAL